MASGHVSALMSGVAVAYTMEGGFYTQVPSLSLSLKYMAVQITNGSKPVMHKAPTRHDRMGIRVATLNVDTMCGRAREISETLSHIRVDACCVQETRWRGSAPIMVTGRNERYKLFWIGCDWNWWCLDYDG